MFCFTPLPNIGKNESIQRNAEGVEPLRHDLLFQMVTLYNILLCHDSVLSSQNVQSHMRSTAHLKSYEIINSMQYTNNCPYICIFIHTDMNIYIRIYIYWLSPDLWCFVGGSSPPPVFTVWLFRIRHTNPCDFVETGRVCNMEHQQDSRHGLFWETKHSAHSMYTVLKKFPIRIYINIY